MGVGVGDDDLESEALEERLDRRRALGSQRTDGYAVARKAVHGAPRAEERMGADDLALGGQTLEHPASRLDLDRGHIRHQGAGAEQRSNGVERVAQGLDGHRKHNRITTGDNVERCPAEPGLARGRCAIVGVGDDDIEVLA